MEGRVNLKKAAKSNQDFRRVLFTGRQCQLVLMSLEPEEEIGEDVNAATDQVIFVVHGKAEALVAGKLVSLEPHEVLFVPAGMKHNLRNVGDEALKLYALYAPPGHPERTVHHTRHEAAREARPAPRSARPRRGSPAPGAVP